MDSFDNVRTLLKISLSAAVPLHIAEFQRMPFDRVLEIARESAQIVAEKGDVIQFRSKKQGATANAFNGLARGLAALAFVPGGVTFLGDHYEAKHGVNT